DRLLSVELKTIDPTKRRTDDDLAARFAEHRPHILGALLDIVVDVLRVLPTIKLATMPRMADFAKILAALDAVRPELTKGKAVSAYLAQSARLVDDVIDSDVFAPRLLELLEDRGQWEGSASDLYGALTPKEPAKPPKGWPKSARVMSGEIKRLAPALRQRGWN